MLDRMLETVCRTWRAGRRLRLGFCTLAMLASGSVAHAERVLVKVGDGRVDMRRLTPGAYRYLRYTVKDGHRIARDIWSRTVAFKTKDGRRLLHLTQRWDAIAPPANGRKVLDQDSWFDAATFRPLTQVRRVTKADGSIVTSGYRYAANSAEGMKELADNSAAAFALPYAELPFNFEYDMELLQTLPLHAGADFDIPFYDAGIDKTADRYTFKVAGSARITGWDGRKLDCWLVTGDYNSGSIKSRWWFDKRTQMMVREAADMPDGGVLIKTLLPPEPADA